MCKYLQIRFQIQFNFRLNFKLHTSYVLMLTMCIFWIQSQTLLQIQNECDLSLDDWRVLRKICVEADFEDTENDSVPQTNYCKYDTMNSWYIYTRGSHITRPLIANKLYWQTSQELWMLSSVTINCQVTKIVMDSGSQLSSVSL